MRKSAVLLTALLFGVAGCEPSEPVYQGFVMEDFFPFDGTRTWEYVSTDVELTHKLVATLNTTPEDVYEGVTQIYTVDLVTECVGMDPDCVDGEAVRSYRMSSDQSYGTLFWGYSTPEAGSFDFDPPIEITERRMKVDDVVTTDTRHYVAGGDPASGDAMQFTSSMEAQEDCPIDWHDNWENCLRIRVAEASDAYPAATYWVIPNYNIVAWTPAPEAESEQWRLIYASWESLED